MVIQRKCLSTLMSLLLFVGLSFTSSGYARCPANDMGCTSENMGKKVKDRVERGKKEVWQARGASGKAKAVRAVVKDCTDCGQKVMSDAISGSSDTVIGK